MDLIPAARDFVVLVAVWLLVASLLPLLLLVIVNAVLEGIK